MPIYEIIDILKIILAHNLAEYQYFTMRPGLFDDYYQILWAKISLIPYIWAYVFGHICLIELKFL